tara:strand:+ start:79 stop:333 length:255 start_codon:yes stop_codon:yes gene_type:complete
MVEEEEECEGCDERLLYSPTDDDYRHLSFMDKPRKDYIAEDFIEAVVYDLHHIDVYSKHSMGLLNELFLLIHGKDVATVREESK